MISFCCFVFLQTKILPAKYIMKTDDDAFVRIDEILAGLKEKPSNGLLYGLISFDSEPIGERNSKWYISDEVCMPSSLSFMFLIGSVNHMNGNRHSFL